MEKNLDNEMQAGIIWWFYGDSGFLKFRGTLFENPQNREYSILVSI